VYFALNPALRDDDIRAVVKEIVASIKPLDNGLAEIPDDAPLFDDGEGEPSPVGLDSLDVLDMALAIGERFGLEGERFDQFLAGEVDFQSLRTVDDIVEFILSMSSRLATDDPTQSSERRAAEADSPHAELERR
jgi:acyl carrier protein